MLTDIGMLWRINSIARQLFFHTKHFSNKIAHSFCKFSTKHATQQESAQWTQSPWIDFDNLKLFNTIRP